MSAFLSLKNLESASGFVVERDDSYWLCGRVCRAHTLPVSLLNLVQSETEEVRSGVGGVGVRFCKSNDTLLRQAGPIKTCSSSHD